MGRMIPKETCRQCGKNLNKGQSITECKKCGTAIHTKCVKKSNFELVNDKWYCETCCDTIDHIYNPFRNLNGPAIDKNPDSNESDKHYDCNIEDVFDDLTDASNILENCKLFKSISELNRNFELKGVTNKNFSTIFQNIDGNRSNFDNFAVHIKQIDHKFSVIGLAETNTTPENKNLYNLDDYTSMYQETDPKKQKGTGVALYVHNSLTANEDKCLSQRSQVTFWTHLVFF